MINCFVLLKLLFGKNGWTVLHIAASKGFEEIVKILLEHGSNFRLQNNVLIFFFFFQFYLFLLFDCYCCELGGVWSDSFLNFLFCLGRENSL